MAIIMDPVFSFAVWQHECLLGEDALNDSSLSHTLVWLSSVWIVCVNVLQSCYELEESVSACLGMCVC